MCAEKLKEKKGNNLIEWYNEVLLKSEAMDFSDVKGFPVYRPYGYAMWEILESELDNRIKKIGVKNAYFPLLIPEKTLMKEKKHIAGFSPEVAWVTLGGKTDLDERLAIRPTSETIMYESYAKWIKSYRDLPLMLNQWNTVVRWETKETRLLLRGKEVMWQEGHCAFATEKEAEINALAALNIYKETMENLMAVPVLVGRKSESEKFAGATKTYTVESILSNNFTSQSATSHELGQNFSKAFDVKFLDENNEWRYVYQTSWGMAMRALGVMVLVHGDDKGLVLPPKIAPIQVVIIPILNGKESDAKLLEYTKSIAEKLKEQSIRFLLDDRNTYSAGWKFNEYDLKGVPIKLEVGERELASNTISLKIRFNGEKKAISFSDTNKLGEILNGIQREMLEEKKTENGKRIKTAKAKEEFINDLKTAKAIMKAAWCGKEDCEARIKEITGAVSRLIPLEKEELIDKKCIFCGEKATFNAYFAKSY
jgi:prolyl-tRNA synthetase